MPAQIPDELKRERIERLVEVVQRIARALETPREEWPHNPDGSIAMDTRPLDLDALLRDAKPV